MGGGGEIKYDQFGNCWLWLFILLFVLVFLVLFSVLLGRDRRWDIDTEAFIATEVFFFPTDSFSLCSYILCSCKRCTRGTLVYYGSPWIYDSVIRDQTATYTLSTCRLRYITNSTGFSNALSDSRWKFALVSRTHTLGMRRTRRNPN